MMFSLFLKMLENKTLPDLCTEPRKLDKKLSGFYYDKKTQLQGSVEVHEDAGERLQH